MVGDALTGQRAAPPSPVGVAPKECSHALCACMLESDHKSSVYFVYLIGEPGTNIFFNTAMILIVTTTRSKIIVATAVAKTRTVM